MTAPAQAMALRQAIPWQKVQDGLYDWVTTYTGLPAVWTRIAPGTMQAPRAYAAIKLSPIVTSQGLDGRGLQNMLGTLPTPPAGQEVRSVAFGLRSLDIKVDIFSDSALFADSAMSYAEALRSSLALESAIMSLTAAGLCQRTKGIVQDLSEVQQSTWVSWAQLEIGFTVAMFAPFGDGQGYVGEVTGTETVLEGNKNGTPASNTFDVKGL